MTVEAPPAPERLSRDQIAKLLRGVLTRDPQSAKTLAVQLGIAHNGPVLDALSVLEAGREVKRIPNTAGSKAGGWVLYDSEHEARIAEAIETKWPYEPAMVALSGMFVDRDYQRPLTSFVTVIEKEFDPVLFQPLSLSDRGPRRPKAARYALMDGQTRWVAGGRIGIPEAPCCVYHHLTPAQEADIFWRLQKNRRGMVSFHVFRAKLRSGDERAARVVETVRQAGYEIGDGAGQIKAVAALEACYRRDPFTLERALADLHDAWGKVIPSAQHIRGLHFFLLNYPLAQKRTQDVNDERLVSRLKVAGVDGVERRALAARAMTERKGGSTERFYAQAIEAIYQSGGRA